MVRLLFILALLAALVGAAEVDVGLADMYYRVDEEGNYHLSDRKKPGHEYNVFAVMRNFPDAKPSQIHRIVRSKARQFRVDPDLVLALIKVESNFQAGAVSHKGAQGLMQIMPSTGRALGLSKPFDLADNIEAGVRYLRMQLDRFKSKKLALAAYNAGPAAVEKYGGVPPYKETQAYVRKVMAAYNKLKQRSS